MQGNSGRSIETVQAELRAMEARATAAPDPAWDAHLSALRGEYDAASRARRREAEDELLTIPQAAHAASRRAGPSDIAGDR